MTAETEPRRRRRKPYSPLTPPSLSMSELVKTTLDHDSTDTLIDKWLEHRSGAQDAYYEWFMEVRGRRGEIQGRGIRRKQIIAWNKGDFVPENIFCRTVDTGRLIPLDRTWTTHVYHHRSMSDRRLSMMPVVFTMLPELMILRGMHDIGCDEIYVIVTDLKRQEMNDVTDYFTLVCRYASEGKHRPRIEEQIKYQHMRLSHTINHQRRTPCFPQIDLTLRAILHEKRPRFLVLFSHQTSSYSQIFFTDPSYVPDETIFFDYPTGCPNPYCTDDCEMIRFPRRGIVDAAVLSIRKDKEGKKRRPKRRQMCNWIDCDTVFGEPGSGSGCGSSEGSVDTASVGEEVPVFGQTCSKCRMVQYCTAEHQRKDWDEHRRVCVKIEASPEPEPGEVDE